MRSLLVVFIMMAFSCGGSAQLDMNDVRECPEAPSLRELMTISVTPIGELAVEEEVKNKVTLRTFFQEGKLFTGWAFTLNVQTVHKFRFYQIVEGKLLREVGYYGNGQLDFDFHYKADLSDGCHMMWSEDGSVILNEFYKLGKPHGRQLRFAEDGTIERDDDYKNGVLVEE